MPSKRNCLTCGKSEQTEFYPHGGKTCKNCVSNRNDLQMIDQENQICQIYEIEGLDDYIQLVEINKQILSRLSELEITVSEQSKKLELLDDSINKFKNDIDENIEDMVISFLNAHQNEIELDSLKGIICLTDNRCRGIIYG